MQALEFIFLIGFITLLPSLVVMTTSFTRYIITLSFLRSAMGTQQTPPNMDGLEALKAIRAQDGNANIVMCSAMGQEAMVIEAIQSGAKDFIVKPFKPERILKTVTSIVGNP